MKKTPLKRGNKAMKRSGFKKTTKKKKRKVKTPMQKAKEALWEECKRITRRDYGNVCYSCGAVDLVGSNWHTGHFITSSTCSAFMRYNLDNLRPQCYQCNVNYSGNWVAYEAHLIIDKGRDFPDQLKKLNEETKGRQYDITWYLEKIEEYKQL